MLRSSADAKFQIADATRAGRIALDAPPSVVSFRPLCAGGLAAARQALPHLPLPGDNRCFKQEALTHEPGLVCGARLKQRGQHFYFALPIARDWPRFSKRTSTSGATQMGRLDNRKRTE